MKRCFVAFLSVSCAFCWLSFDIITASRGPVLQFAATGYRGPIPLTAKDNYCQNVGGYDLCRDTEETAF